jgi:hypothetical protein
VDSAARIRADIFYLHICIYFEIPSPLPISTPIQLEQYTCLASVPDVSRNVAVLKVGCPWKTGGRESGRKPCSQTPTYGTPATAGKHSRDVGNSRDPSSNRNASFKPQGHKQEKAQPQQQKRHQHQDLCGKAIKVAGNEARNMAGNVAMKKKIWWP